MAVTCDATGMPGTTYALFDDITLSKIEDAAFVRVPISDGSSTNFFRGDYTWDVPAGTGVPTTRTISTTAPLAGGGTLADDKTLTINAFAGSVPGAVPTSDGSTAKFLRGDGAWAAASSTIYKTYTWIIKTPGAGWVPGPYIYQACTAVRIDCYVAAATNCVFNIERRAVAPGTAGDDLNSADITALTTLVSDTTLQNTAIAAGSTLAVDIASVSGSPGYLAVCLTVSVP
jgi:hypothetical protein